MSNELTPLSTKIPPEIEDEIFEQTALLYPYRRVDAYLPLICKRSQERWVSNLSMFTRNLSRKLRRIEAILYRFIVLTDKGELFNDQYMAYANLFKVPLESRPPSFFAKHVRNLYILGDVPDDFVQRVLRVCTGVQNFASVTPDFMTGIAKDYLREIPLQHLTTRLTEMKNLYEAGLTFPHLKYLALISDYEDRETELPPFEEMTPSLTEIRFHLRVYGCDRALEDIRTVSRMVKDLKKIRMAVLTADSKEFFEMWKAEDSRVVIEDDGWYGGRFLWRREVIEGVPFMST
ncbi:hypothetical protein K435DRAFT_877838 [Dendrothele bispora CBS 962.96]|uniref:F-box domain-containing protein n=1 Tax=Dendrothele bispora (strain CBS 962.96) TaxID=1314807 RepID=A0A4S8KP53_DENBC|nr:hypothetical protein K435DRAFT_877838 [Dendrothele bispora CBS 962.96]